MVSYASCLLQSSANFMLLYPIRQQSWEYYHSDLQQGKLLGEGAYGMVREGVLRTKTRKTVAVAIKQTKSHTDLDKAKIKEMMKEARLMRLFKHKNIVRIYGVAVDEQPLLIILELVSGGALNSFLKEYGERIDMKEKIVMCIGAGSGVEYLHSNECMHRDLAARNCLITKEKVVKISDFGLSRIGTQYVLKTAMKLPIKWLAPETISSYVFSLSTDVFSFGVLVFEIFANGIEPWSGYSNAQVKAAVLGGQCLSFPLSCPERLRDFFTKYVFARDPAQRATMAEVVKTLKSFSLHASLDTGSAPRPTSSITS
ncbi:Tyrosine-protein kinase Fps85D [Trichostrongylus colubriformis]|uniref:non-specific protein-tyrosine kinase n=1 Tax=Trichostrongylus colubriformis TaxID=6319 RepID=A0AAN8FJK9_TRICO